MSIETTRGLKNGHTTRDESDEINHVARELQLDGWGEFDAKDVLAQRLDDTTVRQAAEVER